MLVSDLFLNFLNSLKFWLFFSAYIQVTHVITQSNIEKDFLHFSAILITDFNQTSMNFIIISIMIHQLIQIGNLVEINFFRENSVQI